MPAEHLSLAVRVCPNLTRRRPVPVPPRRQPAARGSREGAGGRREAATWRPARVGSCGSAARTAVAEGVKPQPGLQRGL
jgi:hypothetical protein